MSMSLPKIRSATSIANTEPSKQIKFKKIKLNTDTGSAADIRQRFKSVKTQRLSNLQRYSTISQQKQLKNQKIHLNLLQRKLLSGSYDQTIETTNDLNSLKQKRDQYKLQSIQKKQQAQRIKQKLVEIQRQITLMNQQKNKRQSVMNALQDKVTAQKQKTEHIVEEGNVLDNMILERKAINLVLQNKVNEGKAYLLRLKALTKQTQSQQRQTKQKTKNLQAKIQQLNVQLLREHRNREEIMFEKQSKIEKRRQEELMRQQKSKQYVKMLDEIEKESQEKEFYGSYSSILANKFISRYAQLSEQSLQAKYQVMQNLYNKISSYNSFDAETPSKMATRYTNLTPQTASYEQQIKKLQITQLQLQKKNKELQQKYSSTIFTSASSNNNKDIKKQTSFLTEEERHELEKENMINNLVQERIRNQGILQRIARWGERYCREFQVTAKRSTMSEGIVKNLGNLFKVVRNDLKVVAMKEERVKEKEKQRLNMSRDQKQKENVEKQIN